jgi:hypothetical protein
MISGEYQVVPSVPERNTLILHVYTNTSLWCTTKVKRQQNGPTVPSLERSNNVEMFIWIVASPGWPDESESEESSGRAASLSKDLRGAPARMAAAAADRAAAAAWAAAAAAACGPSL